MGTRKISTAGRNHVLLLQICFIAVDTPAGSTAELGGVVVGDLFPGSKLELFVDSDGKLIKGDEALSAPEK